MEPQSTVIYEGPANPQNEALEGASQFIRDTKFVAKVLSNEKERKEYIQYRKQEDGESISEDEAIQECTIILKELISVASKKIPPMITSERLKAKVIKKQFFRDLRELLGDNAKSFLGDVRIKTT